MLVTFTDENRSELSVTPTIAVISVVLVTDYFFVIVKVTVIKLFYSYSYSYSYWNSLVIVIVTVRLIF